jgi:dynamin 1-like protein
MIDMVPKAIMLNLVSRAKEELQRELLTELYKADVLDDLLHESEFTQQRRKECKKMIEVRTVHDGLGLLLKLIFFFH